MKTFLPMRGHLISGFLPKSSERDPAMSAKKMEGIEPRSWDDKRKWLTRLNTSLCPEISHVKHCYFIYATKAFFGCNFGTNSFIRLKANAKILFPMLKDC